MSSSKKIKCLIGIDQPYTQNKIVECFNFRDEYDIEIFDKDNAEQQERKENLFYNLYWLEYENLDFEKLLGKKNLDRNIIFNSYCIRKGLIRKAQLAFYLKKYIAKKTESSLNKYFPETHIFELDYLDYLDEALNDVFEVDLALKENDAVKLNNNNEKTKKFILKSSMTNKGAEILLFDSRKQLEGYFMRRVEQSEDESIDLREWVIQEYIDNPLLLSNYGNRKFHLRVYVVAVGNLQVYVYNDILALFSLKAYESIKQFDDDFDKINLKPHITNTCFQLDNLETKETNLEHLEDSCVKRFWSLNFDDNCNKKDNDDKREAIFNQIKDCVSQIFNCLSNEPTVFQPLDNAFELYGFDFLVNENYNCYFLEANAFPDFKQTGKKLNDLIDCLFYQTAAVSCDNFFNIPKVCDTNKMSLVYEKRV